jgi:archaellum component FlaF (FlaF/FlaG flagellin family)
LSFNGPVTLNPADPQHRSITGPVHFSPVNYGTNGGTITITTTKGTYSVGVQGNGLSASALLTGTPKFLAFEGTAINTAVTHDVIFNNQGSKPLKITSILKPTAPFAATGLPAIGTTIAPGASVGVVITYAPVTVGQFDSALTLNSDKGGSVTLDLSGTAGNPGKMTVTPTSIAYPNTPVGSTVSRSFTVSNTGGSVLRINKSHLPVNGTFVATSALNEGSQLLPGQSVTETVKFAPKTPGRFTDQWILNGDGNSDLTYVNFTGTAT